MKKNGEYDPPKDGSFKKTCKVMKFTMLVLVQVVCFSLSSVYAQEEKLDINLDNANFSEFMEQVKRQTDFTFFFNDAMVMNLKNITLHLRQTTIAKALQECLKGTGIAYRFKDRIIILYALENEASKEVEVKGMVVDEFGAPLPGATVKLVNVVQGGGKGLY